MHRSNMLFDVREPSNPHMADATMSHEISFNCGVTQQAFPVAADYGRANDQQAADFDACPRPYLQ